MKKILLSFAPVAHEGVVIPCGVKNPKTPEEIAAEVINCTGLGAAMVHLHVRNDRGEQTADLKWFTETIDLIRAESDIVIQGSTGGVAELSLEERCVSLSEPRVEVASLNMGSANLGDGVYINTLPDIRYWAKRMQDAGCRCGAGDGGFRPEHDRVGEQDSFRGTRFSTLFLFFLPGL